MLKKLFAATVIVKIVLVLIIIIIAIFMAYIPHLEYPYPVHHDEWMKMAYSHALSNAGSLTYTEPFSEQTTISGITGDLENGFYVFCVVLQQISGIDWTDLFTYFPAFIFAITVMSVYILSRRQGFGLEAAFFTSLLPTSIGILGPAFMVPQSIGIMYLPLMLFLAFNFTNWPAYLLLFLINSSLLIIHGPTAIVICIILFSYIVVIFRRRPLNGLMLLLILIAPFLLMIAFFFGSLMHTLTGMLNIGETNSFVKFPDLLQSFGYVPLAFSGIGVFYLFIKGDRQSLGLVFGMLVFLVVQLLFFRFNLGLSILYERGLNLLLLLLSITAGAGLSWLRCFRLSGNGRPGAFIWRYTGLGLACAASIIILATAIPGHLSTDYYYMINKDDYGAFKWIGSNLPQYKRAILDPWKATAFTALTQKNSARRIFLQRETEDNRIDAFLESGCANSKVLRDYGATIIYNVNDCDNPDVIKIKDRTFLFTATDSNQLQNEGFERFSQLPSPWVKWAQNSRPYFLYPEPGRDGGQCVGITISTEKPYDPWPMASWLQNVPVLPGYSYKIGGWIKTENISGAGGASILISWKESNNEWMNTHQFMKYLQGTSNWQYYEGIVTVPPQAASCDVCCSLGGASGTAWFDDIAFSQLPGQQQEAGEQK